MFEAIKLWYDYLTLPKAHVSKVKLTGSGLFCDEYTTRQQYNNIKLLYSLHSASPIVRIPFPYDETKWGKFFGCLKFAQEAGLTPLVLFDCFYSDASMNKRIRSVPSSITYFELFNELPQCVYPGQQLSGLTDVVLKTNEYTKLIKTIYPRAKVLSMAPANSLADVSFDGVWGGDNGTQLNQLARNTTADIISVHLYMDDWKQKARFKQFIKTAKDLTSQTGKQMWITETGVNSWNKHVDTFEQWTSRFKEYLPEGAIIWYRQAILDNNASDGGFALHDIKTDNKSPLWERLTK